MGPLHSRSENSGSECELPHDGETCVQAVKCGLQMLSKLSQSRANFVNTTLLGYDHTLHCSLRREYDLLEDLLNPFNAKCVKEMRGSHYHTPRGSHHEEFSFF